MAAEGYRDDIVVSGPLTTDDYFILTNSLAFGYQGALSTEYSHTLFTLGLVTAGLNQSPNSNVYPSPQILFSAPLTAKVIDKTPITGAIAPLYVKYQGFDLSYITQDGYNVPQVKTVLQAFDKNLQSVGYIQQNFAYLSQTPVTITLKPQGVTYTDRFSAGLPFSFQDAQLGYGYCDNIGEGYCSYSSDANYGDVYEGRYGGTPTNRVIAIPISYYQNTECDTLVEHVTGGLPQLLAYQECLSLDTVTTYSLSSNCQNIPRAYTNTDTCAANPNGAYVPSSAGTNKTATCGTPGQYLPYYSNISESDLTEVTTTFGPCSGGNICLYDEEAETFSCVNDGRSSKLILLLVLGIIIFVVIVCVVIAALALSKKHKVSDQGSSLDPDHLAKHDSKPPKM